MQRETEQMAAIADARQGAYRTARKRTDQHVRAFALRDDFADVLEEILDADARVGSWIGAEDHDTYEQVLTDLAEQLIIRGWVVQPPDLEEEDDPLEDL